MTQIADFEAVFIRGGHRLVERVFGHSNAVNRQLIAACGGPELLAKRRAAQKTGRKAGGKTGE